MVRGVPGRSYFRLEGGNKSIDGCTRRSARCLLWGEPGRALGLVLVLAFGFGVLGLGWGFGFGVGVGVGFGVGVLVLGLGLGLGWAGLGWSLGLGLGWDWAGRLDVGWGGTGRLGLELDWWLGAWVRCCPLAVLLSVAWVVATR
jgi:hypothetical protein